MRKSPKYLIVSPNELELATELRQPVRAHQNLEIYAWFDKPRIFVEVTDSVKFKRDRMGRAKFVSTSPNLVLAKRAKGSANPRSGNGSSTTRRKAG